MDRLARSVSWLFNPLVSVTILSVALFCTHERWRSQDLAFWLLLAVLPGLILAAGLRVGFWSDPDISNLRERRTYLPWAALCGIALAAWAFRDHFPAELRFASTAIALWLSVITLVSTVWKISMHEGATVGVILLSAVLLGGVVAVACAWAPLVVGWARLRLNQHTLAQLLVGALAATASVVVAALVSPP